MIKYVKGDVTKSDIEGKLIIAHLCNNIGAFGAGVSGAIGRKWPIVEMQYRKLLRGHQADHILGYTQFVVDGPLVIANMIAQNGIGRGKDRVDYVSLEKCLEELGSWAKYMNIPIVMPRIGCGLAGSSWDKIEPYVVKMVLEHNVDVYIYDKE